MINRRGFLAALLAGTTAPAIVRSESLMKLAPPTVYRLWGDGIHDDTRALQMALLGYTVKMAGSGLLVAEGGTVYLPDGKFRTTDTLRMTKDYTSLCGDGRIALDNSSPAEYVLYANASYISVSATLENHRYRSSADVKLDCGHSQYHLSG